MFSSRFRSSLNGSVIFELKLNEDDVLDQMFKEIEDPYEVLEQMSKKPPEEVKHPCPGLSFIEYRQQLTRLCEGIYKKIIRTGTGSVIDLERMSVTYPIPFCLSPNE